MKLYSIYDKKAAAYNAPLPSQTDGTVARYVQDVLKKGGQLATYAEDFDIYRVGTFDQETGVVTAETPTFIVNVGTLKTPASTVNDE